MSINLTRVNVLDKLNAFDSVVNVTDATLSVTAAAHKDKLLVANRAAGVVFTLPAATAATIGNKYAFFVGTTITSNAFSIVGASDADLFYGAYTNRDNDTAFATISYAPTAGDYQIISNGSTTGGVAGSYFVLTCLGLNAWLVQGEMIGTGAVESAFDGAQ